jgi:solute carrier family 25 phosphate transporter 23/24/25/41
MLIQMKIEFDEVYLRKFLRVYDKNGDGKISFDEWSNVLVMLPIHNIHRTFMNWKQATTLDPETCVLPPHSGNSTSVIVHLFSTALAKTISKSMMFPLERMKLLLQISGKELTSQELFRKTIQWQNCWKGNGIGALKFLPETAIRFYVYEKMKQLFARSDPTDWGNTQVFVSGCVSACASNLVTHPFDVVSTRLATGAFDKTLGQSWNPRFLWSGLTMSLMSKIPTAGLNLVVSETTKKYFVDPGVTPSTSTLLSIALVSSVFSQTLTHPFNTLVTRIMNGTFDTITVGKLISSNQGLMRGLTPALIKTVPQNCLAYLVYEKSKRWFVY